MPYILLITFFSILAYSIYEPKVPTSFPISVYIIIVLVKINEKWYNFRVWKKQNYENERRAVNTAKSKADVGGYLEGSSIMPRILDAITEKYIDERDVRKRKLCVEIAESFFMK